MSMYLMHRVLFVCATNAMPYMRGRKTEEKEATRHSLMANDHFKRFERKNNVKHSFQRQCESVKKKKEDANENMK